MWQPLPNGKIRLLGLMSNSAGVYPHQHAYYRPIWKHTTYAWTAAEVCSYCQSGPGGRVVTGC